MTVPDRPVRLEQAARDRRDEHRRERERHGVDPVREMRARRGDDRAARERPGRGRRPFDELEQRVRGRKLLVGNEIGQPRKHGRPEERVPDPRHGGESNRRRRRVREGQRREHREPPDVGGDHQPLPREPVDDRPEEQTEEDRGQNVDDEQRADPPAGMRAVVDIDLECDHRQPVAEARTEGRNEKQPEPAVAEQGKPRGQVPGHLTNPIDSG